MTSARWLPALWMLGDAVWSVRFGKWVPTSQLWLMFYVGQSHKIPLKHTQFGDWLTIFVLFNQSLHSFVFLSVEQYYLGLVLSKREDDPLQNKVYSFYKQKNKDISPGTNMWLPFVSQVCMVRYSEWENVIRFTAYANQNLDRDDW